VPIAEAMMALVVMDHLLRHRGQNADVQSSTPIIAAQAGHRQVQPGKV
jgi:chorismate synthase